MEFKVGNVKIHTSVAGIVGKCSREMGKNKKKNIGRTEQNELFERGF